MTTRRVFLLMLAAACSPSAYARLGESTGRIEARYGAPVKVENGSRSRDFKCTYQHNGFTIVVQFLDDKSESEQYSKEDGPLAEDEIARLLEVNRGGGKWKKSEESKETRSWRSDVSETATYHADTEHPTLEVSTRWWREYLAVRPKESANDASKLKDF